MTSRLQGLLSGDGMKARAIRGTALSVLGFGGGQFIRLASNLILTRILFPEAFGLMALVQVVLSGLEMFSDIAIGPSIVRSERGDDPRFLKTAWTLQIIRGVILWIAACALTLPVAQFYGQDDLIAMIPVVALSTIITGFGSIYVNTANRHLTLGKLTVAELGSQVLGIAVMIALAWWLQTVWALVYGSLAIAFFKTALSHLLLPGPANRIGWDQPAFLEIFHFGKYIFIGTISGFFIQHGDRMILGKFITLEALAVYTIAFTLASFPQILGGQLVNRVLLPLYRTHPPAQSAENRHKIGRVYWLTRGFLLVGALFFALAGEPLIAVLYDARYQAAGALLVLLSLSILPRILITGYDAILLAAGNSRSYTILLVGTAIFKILVLFVLVSKFGLVGAILTPVLVDILTYPALIYFIRPYGGWYLKIDTGLLLVSALICALALWNSPAAWDVLTALGG